MAHVDGAVVLRARSRSRSRSGEKCRKIVVRGERHLGVSAPDLEDVFSRVGFIERCTVSGQIAALVFEEARNAREAVRRFDRGTLSDQLITVSLADEETWQQSFLHISVSKMSADCVYGPWKCLLPLSLEELAARTATATGLLDAECQFTYNNQVLSDSDLLPVRGPSDPLLLTLVIVEKPCDGQVVRIANIGSSTSWNNLADCVCHYGPLEDVQYNAGKIAFVRYTTPEAAWTAALSLDRNYRFHESHGLIEASWCGDVGPELGAVEALTKRYQVKRIEHCVSYARFSGENYREDPRNLWRIFGTYGMIRNMIVGGTDTFGGIVEFNCPAEATCAAAALHGKYRDAFDGPAVEVTWLGSQLALGFESVGGDAAQMFTQLSEGEEEQNEHVGGA